MAGCNRGGPKSVVVTGTVVYRGKPVDSANVLFVSKKHPSATGRTNDQGRFELTTFVSNDGTNAEEQSVCITKMIPNPPRPQRPVCAEAPGSAVEVRFAAPVTAQSSRRDCRPKRLPIRTDRLNAH